ncbi:37S ribosomal protein S8, mitochondrial [Mycena indigotica]|uniref:37S ribosomal protein S8, mitochondrial n=1 Tax=Mycena indigotica TaxID=2126181 RepID=A0A8H6S4Y2_9AGAR|nr:37S ribosomal protein S8, mitochondrial [Mycena indigotica]KAF7291882.1 37S ribosomal protein S8, mitochondrial [Mycena indigotica]
MLAHDLCARIQNAFRSRHQNIAVHHSTQNLGILSILLRSGFVSNVSRGTITAADPSLFNAEANDANKRIWAVLKYRNDLPVLHHMSAISKPSKRVFMDLTEIRRLCTGRRAQDIPPLGLGEIIVIKTESKEHEWLEAREAVQMKLAGEVICRAQ